MSRSRLRLVGRAEQDRVHPHAVAIGARRKVPAGLVGVARLDAVEARIDAEQGVTRLQAVPGDRDRAPAREAAEDRRGHVEARQGEHVPRRGVCAGLVEPVRRAVDRVAQAEPARLRVHEQTKRATGSAGTAGRAASPPRDGGLRRRPVHGRVREHDRRVVGRVHDQRRQQRVHVWRSPSCSGTLDSPIATASPPAATTSSRRAYLSTRCAVISFVSEAISRWRAANAAAGRRRGRAPRRSRLRPRAPEAALRARSRKGGASRARRAGR